MWIASKFGWLSIVNKGNRHHVRACVEADLRALHDAAGLVANIKTWPQADYRYRTSTKRQTDYSSLTA